MEQRSVWSPLYANNDLGTLLKTQVHTLYFIIFLLLRFFYSPFAIILSGVEIEFKTNGIQVNDTTYNRDDWTNVTPTVLSKMERKLHLQPRNPIGIIRQLIEDHFQDFTTFNNVSPIVTTQQNFDDLLIPKDHPSRTKSDNYYFNKDTVLRAHTSAHQLQGLASGANKFLISGDVYRRDEIDSSHYPVFHQIEGLAYFEGGVGAIQADLEKAKPIPANIEIVDDTVIHPGNPRQEDRHSLEVMTPLVAHLKHSINSMICHLFADEPNLKVRWIEAYFPFTSPSYEVEIFYQGEWLEVLGCGVVQQKLLDKGSKYSLNHQIDLY